ncbi:hypothetical protein [Chamaesiphon sp. VAR_48_metabat_403]|nr:hypothetical protein [Chamaesiphon sp. VAR_48_metabat_403]
MKIFKSFTGKAFCRFNGDRNREIAKFEPIDFLSIGLWIIKYYSIDL